MGKALRIFFRTDGANPRIVVLCLLVAGLFEGVGITSLLPILAIAQGSGGGKLGRLAVGLFGGVRPAATITALLGVMLLGIALKAALTWVAMRYVGYSVAEVSARMRTKIVRHL